MSKVNKYNEFINNEQMLIIKLIEEAEHTNSSNLEAISQREPYRKVVEFGEKVIPYLLERNIIMWNIALSELTGEKFEPYIDEVGFYHLDSNEVKEFWKKWASENGY